MVWPINLRTDTRFVLYILARLEDVDLSLAGWGNQDQFARIVGLKCDTPELHEYGELFPLE